MGFSLGSIVNHIREGIQDVTGLPVAKDDHDDSLPDSAQPASLTFESFLKNVLTPDKGKNSSEEELFAALSQEQVRSAKGDEAAQKYQEAFLKHAAAMKKGDGFVPAEDCAKAALKDLRSSGVLSSEEADKIYSEAFAAAQLDDNAEALFDSRGGAGDTTIAMAELEAALLGARVKLDEMAKDAKSLKTRSLDEASNSKFSSGVAAAAAGGASSGAGTGAGSSSTGDNGAGAGALGTGATGIGSNGTGPTALALAGNDPTDGPSGFLFKPISENEHLLAVLLPEAFAHKVTTVLLRDAGGNVIDEGRSTGYGDLGTREKFAFNKQGGQYPKDLTVEVRFADGSVTTYSIPDPSQRYD